MKTPFIQLFLKTIRECRKALDFHCLEACGSRLRGVDGVICEDLTPAEFFKKHRKASAINKTDDVCWLWCAEDLPDRAGRLKESICEKLIDSEGHICYFLYSDGKLEKRRHALGTDSSGLRLSILLNAFRDGHFREYRDLRSGEISGSWAQLWTTAAFIGVMVERQ